MELECGICWELMRSPIFLCPNGHTLCGNCSIKLNKCPTCRVDLPSREKRVRNYYLEHLSQTVKYPCKFKPLGCKQLQAPIVEIEKHEKICEFEHFKCPVENCNFDDARKELIKHVKTAHSSILGINVIDNIKPGESKLVRFILCDEDKLFQVCCTKFQCHVHSLNTVQEGYFNLYFYYKNVCDKERHISVTELCSGFDENEVCNISIRGLRKILPKKCQCCILQEERLKVSIVLDKPFYEKLLFLVVPILVFVFKRNVSLSSKDAPKMIMQSVQQNSISNALIPRRIQPMCTII